MDEIMKAILNLIGNLQNNSSNLSNIQGGTNQGSSLYNSIISNFINLGLNGLGYGFGLLSIPGFGNSNNKGSTDPVSLTTTNITNEKQGFFDNIKGVLNNLNKGKDLNFKQLLGSNLKDFGKSIKNGGAGYNMILSGLSMANQYMNKDLVNSNGFNNANAILNGVAGVAGLISPEAGLIVKGLLTGLNTANRLTANKTEDFSVDTSTKNIMGGSYSGSYDDMALAESLSGLLFGGTNKKAFNNVTSNINESLAMDIAIQGINQDNQDRLAMVNTLINGLNYNNLINGGLDYNNISVGKKGIKLECLSRVKLLKNKHFINLDTKRVEEFKLGGVIEQPTVESDWVPIITEPVDSFKNGGVLDDEWIPIITDPVEIFKDGGKTEENELVKLEETNLKNIIPEGALHKNKHHIENTKGLTQKGIPVIDNDGEQLAEIELDEIIFTLEVTKKLEELHKKYKEGNEQAAIEAGKLLVQEILYNTDDRTGLIAKCLKGGKL